MDFKKRYTKKTISAARVRQMQGAFLEKAGPAMKLMIDLMESVPNVSLCVKDASGRIMFTNRYNIDVSGWRSPDDMVGYTSEELYPPDQAAVYANRDREVMETGEPIVERMYGFVADRSPSLNCVTVRPVLDVRGRRIGTATVYWRAQQKMVSENWYEPIRRAVTYLNEHYADSVNVEGLAAIANYSVAQFRRLFRALMHMSPGEYIMQTRINAAKTLLRTTDRRITDIATETGFFDHAHFIRTFRRITGTTPARYRKSISGAQEP